MKSGERGWKRWREEESDAEIAEGKRGKDVDCRVGVGNHRVPYDSRNIAHGSDDIAIQRFCDKQYTVGQSYNDASRYVQLLIQNGCEKVRCWISVFIHGANRVFPVTRLVS